MVSLVNAAFRSLALVTLLLRGSFSANLCMDIAGLDSIDRNNGGTAQVWDCLSPSTIGTPWSPLNQQWTVPAADGNPQVISSAATNGNRTSSEWWLCLDLLGGDTTNGNQVGVWECNGLDNQNWVFGDDWHIRYYNDQSKCVDAGDMQDGTSLIIWDCNDLSQQRWGYDWIRRTIYLADSRRLEESAPQPSLLPPVFV